MIFTVIKGTALIQSHGCSEGQSTCLTPGEEYVIYCFVDNGLSSNIQHWVLPGFPAGFSIFNTDDVIRGGFTARIVSSGSNTINSSLTFTANMSLDEGVVMCRDNTPMPTTDSCTLLVDSKL